MSGIVGILNLDGAPVEPRLLELLTDLLAFRGPDARRTWLDGHVGFGHTALWTTFEAPRERQPASLDGQVWITADARVDGRAELIQQLAQRCGTDVPPVSSHGQDGQATRGCGGTGVPPLKEVQQGERDLASATDVDLLLHAYHAWGENCVEHLLGDFAFAIWDGRERRLFCARDHMGVKPFYYAQVGHYVVFSNTLDCLRQHPAVSDKLNDAAIGDFLLFGSNQDPATTTFADIQRLPAAHSATWSGAGFRLGRYWTLPIDEPTVYPRPADYTERFKELLHVAVRDRVRTGRMGIFMSGGLDSSSIAATACDLLRERPESSPLQAFTVVFDRLMPDRERYYAGLVAKHLEIPIHFCVRDHEAGVPWSEQTLVDSPEPVLNAFGYSLGFERQRQIASHSRVFLYGEGPDNALSCEWRAHLVHLIKEKRWSRLLPDFWFHLVGHPRVPFVGRVRRRLERYGRQVFPAWLNPDFARRVDLRQRWGNLQSGPALTHPTRPKAYQYMSDPLWQDFFAPFDVVHSRTGSEVWHPYLDIRFVRFMLSVPAIPWCCNKYLSRRAMRGILPTPVLRRPKSPLAKDPDYERARRVGMPKIPVSEALLCYVVATAIPASVRENISDFRADMWAIALAFWLRNLEARKGCITAEGASV